MNTQLLKKINPALIITPLLAFSLGMATLTSTSPDLARHQIWFFVLGLIIYFAVSYFDYRIYMFIWKYIYVISMVLLLATFIFGVARNEALRWIQIGNFTLQPSEFAKIAVVIGTSAYLISHKEGPVSLRALLKLILIFFPSFFLVAVQPDLGTSIVLIASFAGILFYSGVKRTYFMFAFLFAGIFSAPIWNLLKDYQKYRILVFLNPTLDTAKHGYNVIQSMVAVGSGGLLGRGFGRGTQSHLRFLPVYWTDFIFAAFAEEWGFVGVVLMLILYLLILISLIYTAYKVKNSFGSILVVGVFFVFFFQFVINVGMNLGLMPVTGVTLPMVSYGGSSLITAMFLLGLAQSVWLHRT